MTEDEKLWNFVDEETSRHKLETEQERETLRKNRVGICAWVDWIPCDKPGNPFCEEHTGKICEVCSGVANSKCTACGYGFLCPKCKCPRCLEHEKRWEQAKASFKDRYVLAEGIPWSVDKDLKNSNSYVWIGMCKGFGVQFHDLKFPQELWHRGCPRYRLVLERI